MKYFPIPAYLVLLALTAVAAFKMALTWRDPSFLSWTMLALASAPFITLMLRIQIKKDLLRTHRGGVIATAIVGTTFSLLLWLRAPGSIQVEWNASTQAFAGSLLSLAIVLVDTFRYNRLKRPSMALEVGSPFPSMVLPDSNGQRQSTDSVFSRPTLVLFIRGSWCPLCMAQLKEVAAAYRELDRRGVQVAVISAQLQEQSKLLAGKFNVPMIFLVDEDMALARKLDLVHINGTPFGLSRRKFGKDTVFPTVLLVNERQEVVFIEQTDDITLRPEPATFLEIIDKYKINHELELKVRDRTAGIKDLLDNIGEGFFSFGQELTIHPERSSMSDLLLGKEIKHLDPLRVLKAKDPDQLTKLLAMVFSGETDFELVRELMPREVKVEDKVLEASYRWVAQPERPPKIIVIVRDITLQRALEEKAKKEEAFNNMIVRVAIDQEGFLTLLRDARRILALIQDLLSKATPDVNELFRHLHTIKGGMGIFGLSKVAQVAHEAESLLAPIRTAGVGLSAEDMAALSEKVSLLHKTLAEQLGELGTLLREEESEPTFKVSSTQLETLKRDLLARTPPEAWEAIQSELTALRKQPVRGLLQRYLTLSRDLGDKLGKKLHVHLVGGDVPVFYDRLEPVMGALVHLVRNSIDHGLESPEQRASQGKPEEGTLRFEARAKDGTLELVVADDGGGINPARIKEVALQKKILGSEALEKMSPADAIKLIFSPGFSSKDEVTDVSGRGVGMNAVKAAVEEARGRISVRTEVGRGTEFTLTLPEVA